MDTHDMHQVSWEQSENLNLGRQFGKQNDHRGRHYVEEKFC
jgi:hypothetical protein